MDVHCQSKQEEMHANRPQLVSLVEKVERTCFRHHNQPIMYIEQYEGIFSDVIIDIIGRGHPGKMML